MSKLTEKQQRFVQGMAQGLAQIQAALLAGYGPTSAKVTASQLAKRPDIKAAIKAAKKSMSKQTDTAPEVGHGQDDENPILKANYDTPGALMFDAMNSPRVAFGMRVEIAKQLLPYYHPKVGEKGKKEAANERAAEIANGGDNVTAFRKRQPPRLAS